VRRSPSLPLRRRSQNGQVTARRAAVGTVALLATVLVACNSDGRTLRPAGPTQTQSVYTATTTTVPTTLVGDVISPVTTAALAFQLQLPFADGAPMDARFTCNGANVHPQVSWLGAPATAVEMALVVTDIDAGDFVHWIIAGLDPFNSQIGEGDVPVGAIEGQNGFSTATVPSIGWSGPCPPAGVTHNYRFTLYALDQQVELATGSSAADMQSIIDASAIGAAQVTGTYATP
jgi:Raf kinase inhibitor-like YbhB/YbcL family protein